jgi:serine/threonine protein kinase
MFVCTECGGPQPTAGHCPQDGTPLMAIGEDVLLGTTIGAYRVAVLLGIGGMGRVYKGVHPTIGSRVAIKVLSRECTDRRDLVERFFAEAKAVNLIRHESIVNILDLSSLPDGRPYIIMEYLDGAPLAAIVDHAMATGTPMPLGGLARLAVEVLDALHAAHGKGIVHRDLKPDNIFVAPSGRPKVLDFGIAKLTDPSVNSSTRTGSLLGTPHYMSPEQAAGRPVDHRADIYAIGVILFECVTGRKLFVADSLFDLLRKQVEEPPPPPRMFRPDLDPGIEALILCALAKAPEHRFATAQAMSLALQQATAHLPPEQWTPITSSGRHHAVPSWHQQAPATWSSRVQRVEPNQPPRGLPRPSEQPLDRYLHQSTVSASSGQVQKQPPTKKSKKGLWIALGSLAVIGAIVAVAVVTSQSDDGVVVADNPSPPPPTTPPVDKPAGKPVDKPADKPADIAKADAEDLDEGDEIPADIEQQIRETAKNLPKDAQKIIDDTLKGTKTTVAKTKPVGTPKVEDDADIDEPPPPRKSAWIENRMIPLASWNPKRVEVAAFLRLALAEAKKAMPDAQLTRIEANGVTPDGFADLTLPTLASSHGDIELRFISPSAAKPDPKTPVGVPQQRLCEFRISGSPDGIEISPMFKSSCKEKAVPVPTCSYPALWKAGSAQGAPANAVANISYYQASMHGTPKWFFAIGFGHDVVFSKSWNGPGCP